MGFWMPKVTINSIFGVSCGGIFPLNLNPAYRQLHKTVIKTRTPIHGKSFTYYEWNGNFHIKNPLTWKYIQRINDKGEIVSPYCFWKFFGRSDKVGLLNAYAQTNLGWDKEIECMLKSSEKGVVAIPNFFPDFSQDIHMDAIYFANILLRLKMELGKKFDKIETTLYCPNRQEAENKDIGEIEQKALRFLRMIMPFAEFYGVGIIIKISHMHSIDFCHEAVEIGVKAIHAINSVPFHLISNNGRKSPLYEVGGGAFSGAPIKELSDEYFQKLAGELKSKVWLIKGGGVMDRHDLIEAIDMGADTVTACTGPDLHPEIWIPILEEFNF